MIGIGNLAGGGLCVWIIGCTLSLELYIVSSILHRRSEGEYEFYIEQIGTVP